MIAGRARPVLPFLAAMCIGEGVWLVCAVPGLAARAAHVATLFAVIKWAGVADLLWLARGMWTARPGWEAALPRRDGWGMFGAGLAVTLGNPKIMAFHTALLPALVDLSAVTASGLAGLVGVMPVVLAAVDLAWVLAAHRARRVLSSPRAVRVANRLSATAMGAAAAAIAAR